ncbi:hypothetical protein LCGC14_1771890 [marine sediment metagenome]|uniref:Uncharacterized protein n=1 Tax=marine sediment metagenome TaxID=412755 RepID=A0A0F9HKG3_9ZZZZ
MNYTIKGQGSIAKPVEFESLPAGDFFYFDANLYQKYDFDHAYNLNRGYSTGFGIRTVISKVEVEINWTRI